jgi:hypothetical protein
MSTTYQVINDGHVVMSFAGDFSQASSPLTLEGNSTPFQVADACHRPIEAAKLLNRWCHSEGGAAWTPGRTSGLKLRTVRS